MSRITVTTQPKNRISINSPQRTSITSVGVIGGPGGVEYLGGLKDVDASDPNTNETLVYDATSGKYIVKELPIVNGGTF